MSSPKHDLTCIVNFANRKIAKHTVVIQALKIVETGKLANKIQLKEITTDLIRNYKPTKSTKETHQKKIKKLRAEYPDAGEMLA